MFPWEESQVDSDGLDDTMNITGLGIRIQRLVFHSYLSIELQLADFF